MIEAMLQICGIKGKMIDKFSLVLFMEAWRHAQTKNFMKTMGPNLLEFKGIFNFGFASKKIKTQKCIGIPR